MTRIAVIGDLHGFWDERDTDYFNDADYEQILFLGDLPRLAGGEEVAREISQLRRPALLIPGNHDGSTVLQLYAEMCHRERAARRLSRGQEERVRALEVALGPVLLAGYSLHDCGEFSIIAARPHSMGGDRLYFADYLDRQFGIDSLAASAERLRNLVDRAAEQVLFLAHNGPSGLGDEPDSIWGCDFDPARGDFGDHDLRQAIDYAWRTGRRVRAVLAGHMHHRVSGGYRPWCRFEGETLHLNAARVPRVKHAEEGKLRHHLRLEIYGNETRATEIWVGDDLNEIPGSTATGACEGAAAEW
ncbi:metallophosphoesterase [Ectothiorhodospiraceae bacterium WFHF3C12]|nr:metallophosphoesterase [Ectothiorhodospiraceae bacterium WFHF3C12]